MNADDADFFICVNPRLSASQNSFFGGEDLAEFGFAVGAA
jgi:hypothetical protein